MLSRRILRIKAMKALYAHLKSESTSMMVSEKNMLASIDKTYNLYFQMLLLPVEVAHFAEQRIDIAKNKQLPTHEDLNPNTRFIDNSVIRVIVNGDSVNDYASPRKLNWHQYPELIRTIYTQMVESTYYKEYMANEEQSFKEDVKFMEQFYRSLEDCEMLDNVVEEMSIMWADDISYILSIVLRTLSNLRASHTELKISPKFKNEDDLDFVKTLFEKSLINYNENQKYIEKFTSNWDVDRIVFMDNLIMGTAFTELVTFPEIPIKVTLDEYIEISKYYSTPGSSVFINGVLDKVVDSLKKEERIQKSGRGLI